MAKKKRSPKITAVSQPHESSARERVGWQIGHIAETMTLAHPTVQKIRSRITAKLETMADKTMRTSETTKKDAPKRRPTSTRKAAG